MKLTPLDQQLFAENQRLGFEGGGFAGQPLSRSQLEEQARRHLPLLDALIARARDGENWIVGPFVAASLSLSLWYNAMILRDYDEARQVIELCLMHPGPFDRHHRADLPVRLQAARIPTAQQADAAAALKHWIDRGIYSRGRMAFWVLHGGLVCVTGDMSQDEPITPELAELAAEIATAMRRPKRIVRRCEDASNWGDLNSALTEIAWPT